MRRDVHFDEDMVLRRYLHLPAEQQPARESGVKLGEPDVVVQVHTQSIIFGGQMESSGQDPSVIDLKDELQQEMDIQQQIDTRPRPK